MIYELLALFKLSKMETLIFYNTSTRGGEEMSQNFCGNCGNKVTLDGKFCEHCGAPLNKKKPITQSSSSSEKREEGSENTARENQQQLAPQPSANQPFLKKYKWAFIGVAAIVIIFMIFQKQHNKPDAVAETFVDHIRHADIEEAYDLIAYNADEDLLDNFEEALDYYEADKQTAKRELQEEIDFESFSITGVEYEGKDRAEVTGKIYMEQDSEEVYIDMIKEKGNWKVQTLY